MNIRFYIDPETGLPHIRNHNVDDEEVEDVLERRERTDRAEMDLALLSGKRAALASYGSFTSAIRD